MPNTYTSLFLHIVFSVKERRPLLSFDIQKELYPYIGGIARNNNFKAVTVNGTDDHIHMLLLLRPDMAISKAVQLIKGSSSKWIHDTFPNLKIFSWQEGYGAFTVSLSQVEIVKQYIARQKEHHKKFDFKNEYRKLLQRNSIEFDEKYLF